ncbi:hypothetical protein [Ekhidna sp.]|uniref:hypothetical protein n=1 Tax=Ekhidna sp. TaxID=2608089 RepID=UPI003BA8740F
MKKYNSHIAIRRSAITPPPGVDWPHARHKLKTDSKSTPSLSDFLKGYTSVVKNIEATQAESQVHQLDIKEFNIEITAGIAGMDDNEIIIAL